MIKIAAAALVLIMTSGCAVTGSDVIRGANTVRQIQSITPGGVKESTLNLIKCRTDPMKRPYCG